MPYILVRGNLASYSHKYPWRVLVSGLKAADIEQLGRFTSIGYCDDSTIVYLQHPCIILTALEVLGYKVIASSSTSIKQDYNEYMWTMRKEFPEPEPEPEPVVTAGIYVAKLISGTPFSVINALAELGYRVICSSGETEILWTLQRESISRVSLYGFENDTIKLYDHEKTVRGREVIIYQQMRKILSEYNKIMEHSHNDGTCCQSNNYDVCETLDEIKFARGLWKAAMEGDLHRVKSLLEKEYNPREVDSAGYTPLHYAARNGHSDVCEMLLLSGANPDARTRSIKATPLHRAASQGHVETVEKLLKYRANVNLKDADGKTALHRAIEKYASSKETLRNTSLSKTCTVLLSHTNLNVKDNNGQPIGEFISKTCKKILDELGPEGADLMQNSIFGEVLDKYCQSC